MLIALAVFLALVAAIVNYSNNRWEEFVAAHDCKVVAQTAATTSYGITVSGKFGTIVNSATTTWRRNDGVDYTR